MLKALWGYILAKLKVNSSVKKAIKRHLAKRIKEAEARVKEDVDMAQVEFTRRVMEAANNLIDEKQAALTRQVNELLKRLAD